MLLVIVCWGRHGAIHRLASYTTTAILHAVMLRFPGRLHGPALSISICVACKVWAQRGKVTIWMLNIYSTTRQLACSTLQLYLWQRWL